MTNEIVEIIEDFLRRAGEKGAKFFNEAELQHELGYWLRTRLASGLRVYFERPSSSFHEDARGLVNKEIDIVVAPVDSSWHFAIELKCPRNGRVPETLYDCCRDLQFLEQLLHIGFVGGLFVLHVDSPQFYQTGIQTGIYSFFRGGLPLPALISKPTGLGKNEEVIHLQGDYNVAWQTYGTDERYWLQRVERSSIQKTE